MESTDCGHGGPGKQRRVMSDQAIRERVQLFSSLRAAQRALARCLHPSQLAPLRKQGKKVLIRLQKVGASLEKLREENENDAEAQGSA